MEVRKRLLIAICLIGGVTASAQRKGNSPALSAPKRSGAIQGQVVDTRGVVQPGIPITITGLNGGLVKRIFSDPNGIYDFASLNPGIYSIEIALPNFLPFLKAPIQITPGAAVLMNISLRSLGETVQIGPPADPSKARDDWKWALRSASPVRTILRYQASDTTHKYSGRESAGWAIPLRGSVQLLAGNDSRSFGADPGLRTVFDMAYEMRGNSSLDIAGNAGWERGTPAAALRASWIKRHDSGSDSRLALTVRQLFLPSGDRYLSGPFGVPFGDRLQSFSGRYENRRPLPHNVSVAYGALFEAVGLAGKSTSWSPFGQVIYTPSDVTRWMFVFTSESPRPRPAASLTPALVDNSLALPQISTDVYGSRAAVLETGRHLEAAWRRSLGGRYRVEAASYFDSLSNVALSLSAGEGAFRNSGLLQDPFSSVRFLDGGGYSSAGGRTAFGYQVTSNTDLMLSYSYGGGLRTDQSHVMADSAKTLRSSIRRQAGSSIAMRVRSSVPRSHTEITTSYEWLPKNTVSSPDPFRNGMSAAEPFLALTIVQPLPRTEILPGQFQAIADFTNLLAQGYIPIHGQLGRTSYLFPVARSFRGGFSFVF